MRGLFNDIPAVEQLLDENKEEVAAIIIEPVAGNMGCIPPLPGYLEQLRSLCTSHGIVLVFDEVMTGFRLAAGGAQELYNIQADLVTYGKVIGAGMPVGAFGGRKDIMQHIAPLGNVYQAGTLSGNPIAMIAGYTLLKYIKSHPEIYSQLRSITLELNNGLKKVLDEAGVDHVINQVGSMISVHFSKHAVINFETASLANNELFKRYFHSMLARGVYLPPSAFETWFVSAAITHEHVSETIQATRDSLVEILAEA